MSFGRKSHPQPRFSSDKTHVSTEPATDRFYAVATIGATFAIALLFVGSGSTTTGPELCRVEANAEFKQIPIDWDAPPSVREMARVINYTARKGHETRIAECANDTRPAVVTCGFVKCGGLFSLETESTADRLARAKAVRDAESERSRKEYSARKREEDLKREEEKRLYAERMQARARETLELERRLIEEAKRKKRQSY
jgi:hypothetical protein